MSTSDDVIRHNIDNRIVTVDLDRGVIIGKRGRPLGRPSGSGYIIVNLRHSSGRVYSVYAHRVIAYAAYGEYALSCEVIDHDNRNKHDNRAINLIPTSQKRNVANRSDYALLITETQAQEMVNLRNSGMSQSEVAAKFFVSIMVVHQATLKIGAYSRYNHTALAAPGRISYAQDKWISFWTDVDEGVSHRDLSRKHGLSYSAINHRIARRRS